MARLPRMRVNGHLNHKMTKCRLRTASSFIARPIELHGITLLRVYGGVAALCNSIHALYLQR